MIQSCSIVHGQGLRGINSGTDSKYESCSIAAIKEGGLASKFSLETGLWITHVDGEAVLYRL